MPAVAIGMCACNRLLVQLREQNVRDRPMHTLRRAFEQVGKANQERSLPETDRRIQGSKAAEAYIERRKWRSRAKLAVFHLKDLCQGRSQSVLSINP